jgi:hypothetical protein
MKKLLGFGIVRLEYRVFQRPRRRHPVLMDQFVEIPFSHPEQGRAIDLGITADEIMQAGMKAPAVGAIPNLLRLIGCIDKNGLRIPIGR